MNKVSDAIMQLGGLGLHTVSAPGGEASGSLAYLCFPDPEVANYEMLKQVSCS